MPNRQDLPTVARQSAQLMYLYALVVLSLSLSLAATLWSTLRPVDSTLGAVGLATGLLVGVGLAALLVIGAHRLRHAAERLTPE